jgi:hypothetical protein
LRKHFERIFWKNVLRGSSNNLLDLLYNLNKPSNTIRPRGLGETLIKKNYSKKRKLRFYPPEISYLRPLYYYLVRLASSWHLVGIVSTIGINLADELVPTARIGNRKIVGTCRFS